MGAEQSSSTRDNRPKATDAPAKRCYYEVLCIDRNVSDDEIKKAYRKKALELHPDRNYGNAESATQQFAEVQSAYQVLSDSQERAWYDSHREAILRGNDLGPEHYSEHDIQLTSAGDIISLISSFTVKVPFTDASDGFYGILRTTFEKLAREEDAAADLQNIIPVDYPDFGTADDAYEEVVKPFYAIWSGFATRKTYTWKDSYNYTEAPDRRVRRLMEKENKRLRDESIREFNDAVRSLVNFVRKRDRRYTPNTQSEADRHKMLRGAAAAQAARSRAANQAKIDAQVVPEWAKMHNIEDEDLFSESEQSDEQHYECVICKKTFKSEKQYDSHEKSKKHIKAVQQIKRQMHTENERFDFGPALSRGTGAAGPMFDKTTPHFKDEQEVDGELQHSDAGANAQDNATNVDEPDTAPLVKTLSTLTTSSHKSSLNDRESGDSNDEYAHRTKVESRFTDVEDDGVIDDMAENVTQDHHRSPSAGSAVRDEDDGTRPKLGKAKAKRAKKLARQEDESQVYHTCVTCNAKFSSKSKLFIHIKKDGHAQPIPRSPIASKGKKR